MRDEFMPDAERLKELLVGRSIVEARISEDDGRFKTGWPVGYLTLSDGTRLKVEGNLGGCSCGAGNYPLTHLASVENIITNVFVEEHRVGDYTAEREGWDDYDGEDWTAQGYFRIFVIAADERINVASFEGDDGNGWYGTGWYLTVLEEPR